MNPANELKFGVIELLVKVNDIHTLTSVHHQLEEALSIPLDTGIPAFMKAVISTREKPSLQEIMNAQNYKPITYQTYRAKADELE